MIIIIIGLTFVEHLLHTRYCAKRLTRGISSNAFLHSFTAHWSLHRYILIQPSQPNDVGVVILI